jgi:hypothetical protein
VLGEEAERELGVGAIRRDDERARRRGDKRGTL